jgi:hypothetical protein
MVDPTPEHTPASSQGERLDSWKAIAAHFGRDVTTVRRWERREGLPVHRLFHAKLGSVYAYTHDLDEWWRARRAERPASGSPTEALAIEQDGIDASVPSVPHRQGREWRRFSVWAGSGLAVVSVLILSPPARELSQWLGAHDDAAAVRPADSLLIRGVAVLPLTDLAAEGGRTAWVDGMTAALVSSWHGSTRSKSSARRR